MAAWQIAIIISAITSGLLARKASYLLIHNSVTWTFLVHLFAQWFALSIWRVIIYPKLFSPLRHLPRPSGASFLTGHYSTIVKEPSGMPMRRWINEIPNKGLIRYEEMFNKERLLITKPASLADVLVHKSYDFVKPTLVKEGLGRILGSGVLNAEGEGHKVQRKHLMPAFAYRHIKELYPLFWSKAGEMVDLVCAEIKSKISEGDTISNSKDEVIIPFANWLNRVTLDIIGVAGVGCDFNSIHNPDAELAKTYRQIFSPSRQVVFLSRLGSLLPSWIVKLIPIKRNKDIDAAINSIRKVSREIIVEKKKAMQETEVTAEKRTGNDILSVALESGVFSDENLVDQMMSVLAAGHETTASAINWALVTLSQNPEIQTRLRAEIRAELPSISNGESLVSAELLQRLPYLHAVCNEVLRVWAPVPLTRREARHNTTILGQFVPKGTTIILCEYAVNMSKELWGPDALEFNPDRWIGPGRANSGGATSNYALLTFLHGPRSCIGQTFAKAEFACLLAAVIGRLEVALEDPKREIEIERIITAKPKGGLRLKMRIIEGW